MNQPQQNGQLPLLLFRAVLFALSGIIIANINGIQTDFDSLNSEFKDLNKALNVFLVKVAAVESRQQSLVDRIIRIEQKVNGRTIH